MLEGQAKKARLLTLVFTDLADSTALKSRLGDHRVSSLIARHRALVERLTSKHDGRIIDWAGDGCFLTFETSSGAVLFAMELQQAHSADADLPKIRIGVHIGEVTETEATGGGTPRVEGLAVDLAARVSSLARPGQVLMSSSVFNNVRQRIRGEDLGAAIVWLAHGAYELKGFDDPLEICEAGIAGVSPLQPPPGSEKAHRAVSPTEEDTLGWRPAVGLHVPRREHWVLDDRLGEGGFGEVWLAIHAKTKARRVFKFCFEAERVRGLKREVVLFRLLKETLGHRDDIAQIVDWEFERAPYFLESEYTQGGDLRDWAARHGGLERVPLETRLELVAQAAIALGAAHSVGVLHKDIKPANILISEVAGKDKLQASLTDFGIGLITNPGALAAQGITAAGLTQALAGSSTSTSDSGAGTRLYMAPELLEGKPATTLSDIYSLGVVLYQTAMGDLTHAVAPGWERHIDDELLREDIGLCIDGDPERRLKSANELAERLRNLGNRRETLGKRRAAARRRRMLTVSSIAGPIVTLLILGFAFQQTRLAGEANRQREVAEAAREEEARQRTEAEKLRAEAERGQYVSNVRLATTLLDQMDVAAACEILETTPVADRGWEWGHLVNRAWPPEDKLESGMPAAPAGETTAEIWAGATARLVTTLVGQQSLVSDVKFHPDGRRVVTASADRSYVIWDLASATEIRRISVPPLALEPGEAIDPAGRLLATTFGSNSLALWDLETGELQRELRGHRAGANPIIFSPDGALLATLGIDRTYAVWEVATGRQINVLELPLAEKTDCLVDAVFIKDSTQLLTTSTDNRVLLWDYTSGEIVRSIQGPRPEDFASGSISPSGDAVASWSPQLGTILWNTKTGEEIQSGSFGLSNLRNPIMWAPDETAFLYRGDEIAWISFLVRGLSKPPPSIEVSSLAGFSGGRFNQVGNLIALPDPGGPVRIYAPAGRTVLPEDMVEAHSDVAYMAAFSGSGTILATAGFDGMVHLFDAATLEPIRELKAHAAELFALKFSPDDRYLSTLGWDDYARLWDATSGEMLFETRMNLPNRFGGGPRGPSTRLGSHIIGGGSFSPDVTRVALPTGRGEMTVKEVPSGEIAFVARSQQEWSYKNEFSPDGKFLLNLPYQETFLTMFDAGTGAIVKELRGHSGQIVDRCFSPDGSRIISTSSDGTARLWDARTGETVLVIEGGGAGAFSAVFSPDGILAAVAMLDGAVGLYRTDTGDKVAAFSGHGGLVAGVTFSPDGQRLLSACMDGITRVWSLDGALMAELRLGGGEQLYYTGWSPDGRSIVTTSSTGKVRLWRAVDWTAFRNPVESEADFETQLARVRATQ